MKNDNLKFKVIAVIFLFSLALVERLWLDLGPNIELITLVTFIAGFYLGKKWAIGIPLIILAASDIFLGNTRIMLFTWSAYLGIGVGVMIIRSLINNLSFLRLSTQVGKQESLNLRFPIRSGMTVFGATTGGVVASLWFYVWTNFGVWFLDSWGMYPKTVNGLIACYINGIPFFKNQLFSNFLIIPVGFLTIEIIKIIFIKTEYIKLSLRDRSQIRLGEGRGNLFDNK